MAVRMQRKPSKKIIFPAAVLIPTFIFFICVSLLLSNFFNVFSPHTCQFSLLFQLGSAFSFPSSKSHQFAASHWWCSSESIILSWRNCFWQAGGPTELKTPLEWCVFLWAHSTFLYRRRDATQKAALRWAVQELSPIKNALFFGTNLEAEFPLPLCQVGCQMCCLVLMWNSLSPVPLLNWKTRDPYMKEVQG